MNYYKGKETPMIYSTVSLFKSKMEDSVSNSISISDII